MTTTNQYIQSLMRENLTRQQAETMMIHARQLAAKYRISLDDAVQRALMVIREQGAIRK